MSRKPRAASRKRRVPRHEIRTALRARVLQRIAATGTWKLPAVPALLEAYVSTCADLFASSGRACTPEELSSLRALVDEALAEAFRASQRSKISIRYQAEAAQPLDVEVKPEAVSIADTYERWVQAEEAPLFGAHADARVLAVAANLEPASQAAVLDLGSGPGRNALGLARLGHPVDAVELTPKFVEALSAAAAREGLPVRVIQSDIFSHSAELRRYRLVVASEIVPDFRGNVDLRRLFELAARVLEDGGCLVMNLHLAAQGYTPERAAREFAAQCYSALFTANEVARAAQDLGLRCVANQSVHDYEREHLPSAAWPPTPWFVNWASGLDVYELERAESPVELRWLVFEKRDAQANELQAPRTKLLAPEALRAALLRRWQRRGVASGMWVLPALPAMLDEYEALLFRCVGALGREFAQESRQSARALLCEALGQAFSASQRSNVVLSFEAPMGSDVNFSVAADPVPLQHAYAEWFEESGESLFGDYADARVLSLLAELGSAHTASVLDLGAGLGRNAFTLSRRGHAVDAVELTPVFVERMRTQAERAGLSLRVLGANLFEAGSWLRTDYALIIASGLVGDFRSWQELRALFELAASHLRAGGRFVLSVHVSEDAEPEPLAIEWGQQCCAMFFTRDELARAYAGLPLALSSDDSAYEFERDNSPEETFPPTPAFGEWALGVHMYALEPEDSPVQLRWLVFTRS